MMRKSLLVISAVTALLVLVLVPSRHAQTPKRVNLNVTYGQEGCPVEIISATSDTDYYFAKTEVKNVSQRRIQSITVGGFIHEMTGNGSDTWSTSHEIQTDIKPGVTRSVDTFGVALNEARQQAKNLKSGPIAVDFGILEVRFHDGGAWHSVAMDNKHFPTESSSLAPSR